MATTTSARAGLAASAGIITRALGEAAQRPGLLLALYAVNLLATAAAWLIISRAMGPALAGRPEPDLFRWLFLARNDLILTVRLLRVVFVLAGVYLLFGAMVTGAVLQRLGGGSALAGAWRHLPRLLGIRVLVGPPVAGLVVLWFLAGRWLWPLSLAMVDDRGPLLVQAALGLAFAAPLIWAMMLQHYAQALVVSGHGLFRALARAALLIWRAPLLCLAAWSCCWLAWGTVTVIFGLAPVEHPLVAQIAVALRVLIHIWSLAAARRVALEVTSG